MKKVLFAIAMLCMVASSAFAQEEKGRMAVNVHAGISTTAGAQGLAGVEFRVAVADKWRLAPQFNIGGGHDLKFFDVTVDAHYVFNYENSNFSFYPIMGLGFDHYWQKYAGYQSYFPRFGYRRRICHQRFPFNHSRNEKPMDDRYE